MGKLNARKVETAGPGTHMDGGGLRLIVSASGSRKWVFRYQRHGLSRQMGLGSHPDVSLALARERAADARRDLAHRRDPIAAARQSRTACPTFEQAAEMYIAAKQSGWRNTKHREQVAMTLTRYCSPLARLPVNEIDTEAVLAVLKPLRERTPETASRVRGRIEAVLDASRALGHIDQNAANPARWHGHLDKLLGKRGKHTRGHHAAMPVDDVPAFMAKLRAHGTVSALALEFLVLTTTRTGEARAARWDEIDLERRVWTVPASRMKGGREHRVPLSDRALAILDTLAAIRSSEFVFPGHLPGRPLGDSAMRAQMRRLGGTYTVHGFRSSLRDWAGDRTTAPREIAEAALAHATGNAVELAYRRGDALEKRRALMQSWATFCEQPAGNVVQIGRRR